MDNAAYLADHERARSRMAEDWNFLTGLLVAGQTAPKNGPADRTRVPLSILSGFLGAGKTTLVNHLLANPAGKRLLVLVNDFGSINIDEKLIVGRSMGTLALSNGCVCCSLAGDLARKLREITDAEEQPDAIILEASGLSDAHALAYIVDTNAGIELDGVVTILDAERLLEQGADPLTADLVTKQIAGADLLILNKLDLVSPSEREAAIHWLQQHAGGRPIVTATYSDVPIDGIFGIGHIDRGMDESRYARHSTEQFESATFTAHALLDRERVTLLLRSLPGSVLRGKGILMFADEQRRQLLFQRVGKRWSLTPGQDVESTTSSLVLIFPRGALDSLDFAKQFKQCCQRPSGESDNRRVG